MPTEVEFFTDGLGKRRYKLLPNDTLYCYSWDAGYNVLIEYVDDTGQWNTPDCPERASTPAAGASGRETPRARWREELR